VITPPAAPAPAIVFLPSAPFFAPAPAPVVEEKKEEVKAQESATVIVVVPPTLKVEVPIVVPELTTQESESVLATPIKEKILTSIVAGKIPTFKGVGPFTILLGLSRQESAKTISNTKMASGMKVISQTPQICSAASTFDKKTGKYSVKVTGLSNGLCRINAVDNGNELKFPSSLEIKQQITGVVKRKTEVVKTTKTPTNTKGSVSKASYKTKK
jgi:hypothetical protein